MLIRVNRAHREFDEEEDEDLFDRPSRRDREISLGTATLLGIFFALALLCAVFFGFGYSLGSSRHTEAAVATADPSSPNFNSFKPAPGSPVGQASSSQVPASTSAGSGYTYTAPPPGSINSVTVKTPLAGTGKTAPPAYDPDAEIVTKAAPSAATVSPVQAPRPAVAAGAPVPAAAGQTNFIVQIAAFSHQEDADTVVKELKRRGYAVTIHQSPPDQLLHVQVGPFSNRKDADTMRQKLLADGFNAIIK